MSVNDPRTKVGIADDVEIRPAKDTKGRKQDELQDLIEHGIEEFIWERETFGPEHYIMHGIHGTLD